MKVAAKSWAVKSAEQNYRKISPSVKKIQKPTNVKRTKRTQGLKKITPNHKATIKPSDALSSEEKDALKMLFREDSYFSFYGRSKVHQVQPGMLLDVKG